MILSFFPPDRRLPCPALLPASCTKPKPGKPPQQVDETPITITEMATFEEPWAIAFAPGTSVLFVTEKAGTLR